MLLPYNLEEGDKCPQEDCDGEVIYVVENCRCHINPPCSACVDAELECTTCGTIYEEEEI